MPDKNKIYIYQRDIRKPLPETYEPEYAFLLNAGESSSTFIFSEYFALHDSLETPEQFLKESKKALQWLQIISTSASFYNTLIIGGSLLYQENDRIFNQCSIFFNGQQIAYYRKRNPFRNENNFIQRGDKPLLFTHPVTGKVWGVLICNDVMLPDIFEEYKNADFLAIPTNSPLRSDDTDKERQKRDFDIYVKGAGISGSIIFKCCSTGQVGSDQPEKAAPTLQGRSLIADATSVLASAPGIYWTGLIQFAENETKLIDFNHGYEKINIQNLSLLNEAAEKIIHQLQEDCILLLSGSLGAGKTTFTRICSQFLHIHANVNSPTFNLMNVYEGILHKKPVHVYHIDLFRILGEKIPDELSPAEWESPFLAFIEWPEKITLDWESYASSVIKIIFEHKIHIESGSESRTIKYIPGSVIQNAVL